MHLHDLPHQSQPQAGANDLARGLLIPLVAAEQSLDELGGDAHAMVADADFDLTVMDEARDRDLPALWRVLDRVAQQVGHHLGDAIGIALHGRPAVELEHHEVPRARGPGSVGGVLHQLIDVHRLQVKR